MKRLNEKVIMMVRGLMIGSSMAAVLTVLVMGGKLGIWGFISVLGLIVLAGLGGLVDWIPDQNASGCGSGVAEGI